MEERAWGRTWGVMLMFMLVLGFSLSRETSSSFTATGDFPSSTADSEESTGLSAFSSTDFSEGTAGFEHKSSAAISVEPSYTATEAQTATEQSTFPVVTESWTENIISETSTELLNSSPKLSVNSPEATSERENPSTVVNITDDFLTSTNEWHHSSVFSLVQDLTSAGHNTKDLVSTDMNTTESISQAESTYVSTTVNRPGVRTLLSIISPNASYYTEESRALKTPPDAVTEQVESTWYYTKDTLSTEAYHTEVTNKYTNSIQGDASEDPHVSKITQSLSRQPNVTGPELEFTQETGHSSITPLVTVISTFDETDTSANTSDTGTSYTLSVFPMENHTELSNQETDTTDVPLVTVNRTMVEKTKVPVMETTTLDLTTASPKLLDVTTSRDKSTSSFVSTRVSFVSTHKPFVLQTTHPPVTTEVLRTTPVLVTQTPQPTEKDTTATVAITTFSSTNTVALFTTSNVQSSTTAETHMSPSTPPAIETTQGTTQTITIPAHPTSGTTHPPLSPSSVQTRGVPTDVSTPHLETSTASPSSSTTQSRQTTGPYSKNTPVMSTPVVTTEKNTKKEVTTTQMPVKSTLIPGHICDSHPCANGGRCVLTTDNYRCECLPSWTGNTCTDDVNECISSPCPPDAGCVNTKGSFSCECPLGYDLNDGHTCTQIKTFLGNFTMNSSVSQRNNGLQEFHREILQLLSSSLSILHGYRRSILRYQDGLQITAVNMFAMSANITSTEIHHLIQMSLRNSTNSHFTYQVASLCLMQKNRCDTQYSVCNDSSGIPYCQCLEGYFKNNPEDTTCRDCGDEFKLVNGTCVMCTFGFGGFNCNNYYRLIAKVVAPAAGGLLIIFIIALIVTCCRKDKNDINKIIFKSGELQMSPYSEFPKSSRVSMEWGRETIEMQENGSTKNLLQMTDIYYSPALRNIDLERNGLYPFSGLPGSRHSCIYPAQWNPSFLSDDSRRRDYF